jgi:hypothetical protein
MAVLMTYNCVPVNLAASQKGHMQSNCNSENMIHNNIWYMMI